jgi:hypothetical protein
MQQADIDRAVARATGETVTTIRRLGFLLDDPVAVMGEPNTESCDPELCDAEVIDWDALEAQRYADSQGRFYRELAPS